MIRYPPPLRSGSTIGMTAPSSGVTEGYHTRLDRIVEHLRRQGFQMIEGRCLRSQRKDASAPQAERTADFMQLWNDPKVDLIFPPWGGELAHDLLPRIDFEALKKTPTWLQGFSDISTLLLPITLLTDIATSHGCNLMDSVPAQTDGLTRNALDILGLSPGQSYRQNASALWQKQWADYQADPDAPYNLTEPTEWKSFGAASLSFSGRLIGGCLDTICFLIGTRYGDIPSFIRRYQQDGVILYLENCEQNPTGVHRYLSSMQRAGWFDGLRGILVGRSTGPAAKTADRLQYAEALQDILADRNVPVVYDCDIGHAPPQMTLVNGAMAQVHYQQGGGWIEQTFR